MAKNTYDTKNIKARTLPARKVRNRKYSLLVSVLVHVVTPCVYTPDRRKL